MQPYVQRSVIYNGPNLEAARVSLSSWVGKKAVVHLHNRILLGDKKRKIFYPLGQHGWIWKALC